MPQPQTLKNHARFDPAHHLATLLLALNVLVATVWAFVAHSPGLPLRMWVVLVAIALMIASAKARMNPLRAQDRVIRLEEQMRLDSLLPGHTLTLTVPQLIALRFAPDAELPELAARASAENLTPKQIKAAIDTWRPDHLRV